MSTSQTDDLGIEVIDVSSADQALAMDAITRAEIDMAIATAKRYPRAMAKFSDDVVSLATVDRETAEGSFYSLRRQGKTIQGPSVRLAEIAVSCWGNIRAGARILGETPDGKFIQAMGVCHDLEKNVYVAMESQRRITNKHGGKYNDDMIGVTANAAAAIGFRNAVFKVIPKALLKRAYIKCIEVATGGAKTLTERREQVFERLQQLNPLITADRVLGSLNRPSIEEVTLADVTHLIGLGTAIRDGAQSIDEAFPEKTAITPDDLAPAQPESPEGEIQKLTVPEGKPPLPDSKPIKKLSKAKRDLLKRQALELAQMDIEALDKFAKKAFQVPFDDLPADAEPRMLQEIKRRADGLAKK